MPAPLQLPTGFSERPLTLADAGAVTRVMAANELATIGEIHIEEADIVGDWQRPSFDVSAATVGVLGPDGGLVAYAECSGGARADAAVHPDHWGRGIGAALAGWISARAAELGEPVIGMPVPQGSPGDRLLESLGWFPRWESWVLTLPEDAVIPVRDLPEAYVIRAATPRDHEQVWTVIEDAFLEWSEREREPFADWVATVVDRPGAEPWNIRVVTAPDGDVVAAAVLVMTEDGREGTSASWPPARTSATGAWRRRSWPMRSASPAPMERRGRRCRPTPAPARSTSIATSAWRSSPPGSTARPAPDPTSTACPGLRSSVQEVDRHVRRTDPRPLG